MKMLVVTKKVLIYKEISVYITFVEISSYNISHLLCFLDWPIRLRDLHAYRLRLN